MNYPVYLNKYTLEPLFTPAEYLQYRQRENHHDNFKLPGEAIILYHPRLFDYIRQIYRPRKCKNGLYILPAKDKELLLIYTGGIGAPMITVFWEEVIAAGVTKAINLGTAGGLQKSLKIGDLILCDQAIRDEGVSYHYLPPDKYVNAGGQLTAQVHSFLEKRALNFYRGTCWTIDAPYRETIPEIFQYQNEGVLGVDMETAALFAVAQVRKVEITSLFTISDLLGNLKWQPQFNANKVSHGLRTLFQIALEFFSEN
ncbi:nucleoside phosphorylase [candidate division KSB1 bacterium]|nr:nucleoside phosphorylase [candidate division KSB1 bacterium]